MNSVNHQRVRDFFVAIAAGELPEHLVTPDMRAWTVTSGDFDRARFQAGVQLLSSIFGGTLLYTIDALTAEEDRVAAEVHSSGTLINGDPFQNTHVFTFRFHEGRISYVGEFMNPFIVREKIAPLIQAAMSKRTD